MIKAVVFDLDNTLVDFMAMKRQAVEAAIAGMMDAGLRITREQIQQHIDKIYQEQGIEYQRVFDELLNNVLGYIDFRILSAGIVAYRRAREAALKPYPHVTPTLVELSKSGVKLGLVSDAPAREAWLRLCFINYHHLFDAVITYDDTGERKPSPKPFLTALSRLNVFPEEAIMVGDWAERDMLGAKNVGMLTAFARYGDSFGNQVVSADYELDDIRNLLQVVKEHNRPSGKQ